MLKKSALLVNVVLSLLWPLVVQAEGTSPLDSFTKSSDFKMGVGDLPTYIKSDKLTLKTTERVFTYSGNVDIIHGDLHMTCDELEGHYSEKNQIEDMVAKKNVVILKGDNIRASCQKAIYEQSKSTITLTENPELQQDGSVLSADAIVLNTETNKSEAQGNVRVKLVKQEKKDEKKR